MDKLDKLQGFFSSVAAFYCSAHTKMLDQSDIFFFQFFEIVALGSCAEVKKLK